MSKRKFKTRFGTPWLRGIVFSLITTAVAWLVVALLAALGIENFAKGTGLIAAFIIFVAAPWLYGTVAAWVVRNVELKK